MENNNSKAVSGMSSALIGHKLISCELIGDELSFSFEDGIKQLIVRIGPTYDNRFYISLLEVEYRDGLVFDAEEFDSVIFKSRP